MRVPGASLNTASAAEAEAMTTERGQASIQNGWMTCSWADKSARS